MVGEPSRVIDEAELRKRFIEKEFLNHKKFLASVEEEADKVYALQLKKEDGTPLATVRVRRWTHAEANLRYLLPFYYKFVSPIPISLTDEEKKRYEGFQAEMVHEAVLEPRAWEGVLMQNPSLLGVVYGVVCSLSGLSQDFIDRMEGFTKSDYGISYGMIWLQMLGKTPSEIAQLPETDILLIESLIPKMMERMKANG